jgi:predicted nucleic acid-binding protein
MSAPRVYISDTNIWIDFSHAGMLDSLFALPFTFISTDFVVQELDHPVPAGLVERGLVVETLPVEVLAELVALKGQHVNISLEDLSCFWVARQQQRPLLTGDARLRGLAERSGLQVHGALWLLDQLVAHGVTSTAQAVVGLRAMLARGARFPIGACEERLAKWEA